MSEPRRYRFTRFLLFCLITSASMEIGCISPEQPRICKQFFDLTSNQRSIEIKRYDLDTQLEIQVCAFGQHAGPSFSFEIAAAGPTIIPKLSERLELLNEKPGYLGYLSYHDELETLAILDVFHALAIDGVLKGQTQLLPELRKAVKRLDGWTRMSGEEHLRAVEDDIFDRPMQPA